MNIRRLIKELYRKVNGLMFYLGPKNHLAFRYFCSYRKFINWEHPQDLNQWICWNIVFGDHTNWAIMADKYAVREYVESKGLSHLLVPLIKVYDRPQDINIDELPNECVIKTNNGSGDVVIITDKTKIDKERLIAHFENLRRHPFGKQTEERHYLQMPYKILVEELLDASYQDFPSISLIDYKMWYINGEFKGVWLAINRKDGKLQQQWRDSNWNLRPDYLNDTSHHKATMGNCPPSSTYEHD